jgi:hypothetical protein
MAKLFDRKQRGRKKQLKKVDQVCMCKLFSANVAALHLFGCSMLWKVGLQLTLCRTDNLCVNTDLLSVLKLNGPADILSSAQ